MQTVSVPEKKSYNELEMQNLIKEFVPLIKYLANRLSFRLPPHLDSDDLVNAGIVGLMHAVDNYSTDKNTQFRTYAEYRIRGAMLDEIRAMDWLPRSVRDKLNMLEKAYQLLQKQLGRHPTEEEVAEELDVDISKLHSLIYQAKGTTLVSFDDITSDSSDEGCEAYSRVKDIRCKDPLSLVISADIQALLGDSVEKLPEKERHVVSLYYYNGLTMKEIGKVLGITESRVSQLHTQAILRLRSKIGNHIQSPDLEK